MALPHSTKRSLVATLCRNDRFKKLYRDEAFKSFVGMTGLTSSVGMTGLTSSIGMTGLKSPVGIADLSSTLDHQSTPAPNQVVHEVPQRSLQNLVSAHDADP